MSELEIHGLCPPQLSGVRDAFAANFAAGAELGARFSAAVDGELIVDIWGGFADRRRERRWAEDTLVPIFSSTKAIAALLVAKAAGEGLIDYSAEVTELWPEFGQHGKDRLTIEEVLSHQAGLAGFNEPVDSDLWFDWDGMCARIAATAPLWPPGSASGYHAATFGYIAGEIFRRATGRTFGRALREDIAGPYGLDVWIGLPDSDHGRVADTMKPPGPALLGEITPIKRAAFYNAWSAPPRGQTPEWRRAELPSANGHARGPDLARLMSAMACDGRLDGRQLLEPGTPAEAARARICGDDLVLPFNLCWGAGFLRNERLDIYGPGANAFGHSGWGGSCVFADPDRRLSAAYVMNKQSVHLIGDPRPVRLIEALYSGL